MNLHELNFRKIFSPRLLAAVIGIVLLTAAILKAYNIELFIREIRDYQIITDRLMLILGAWGLIIAEFILGTSLLIYYRPRITIPLTLSLFVIFLGAVTWALFTGVTEDCGCFGSWVKRSPGGAIIEDLVMVAILILSWPGQNYRVMKSSRTKPLIIVIALIAGIVLPISFGAPVKELMGISDGQGAAKENLFTVQGLDGVDLKNGFFIFVLIGTDCTHCRDSVQDFNQIARKTDLPKIIALSADSEEQRNSFVKELKPVFPVMGISEDDFYRLLGTGLTPRSILVVRGHVLKMWEEEVPGVDGIKQALGK
jgi:hypothetical protein